MGNDWVRDPTRPELATRLQRREDEKLAERVREFEIRQQLEAERLYKREQQIKEKFGKNLDFIIERCGVQDGETRTIAADYLAKNIAAAGLVTPDAKELHRLADRSIKEAHKFEETQREQRAEQRREAEAMLADLDAFLSTHKPPEQQQQQREPEPERQPEIGERGYYGYLDNTHRLVDERMAEGWYQNDIEAEQIAEPVEHERDDPTYRGRYAELTPTDQRIDVELRQRDETTARQTAELEQTQSGDSAQSASSGLEQPESNREIDDKGLMRQARMRELGHEIEPALHEERDQSRDRGQER
jgi:hypothetical protein